MNVKPPLISILLPVYNGEKYIHEAISSILMQTFEDWELIIINDGSNDESEPVILSFEDKRIRYYNHKNMGLARTLNKGISLARGKYIARQDQDDISLPTRLGKQVSFFEANPHSVLLGTRANILEEDKRTARMQLHPLSDAEIKLGLLFDNFFVHSSVMINKDLLLKVGGYSEDPSRQPPEDYELWSRIMRLGHQLANLSEPLLLYREVHSSMSRAGKSPFARKLAIISAENLRWASDLMSDDEDINRVANLMAGNYDLLCGFSLNKSLGILKLAINGICKKNHIDPVTVKPAIAKWRNQFILRYLDYRTGGLLNNYVKGPIRRFIKKVAFR
jgi:glycosyltransferase involved in cell wall biosynthesis